MTVFTKGKDAFPYAFKEYTDTVYRIAVHNTSCIADAEDITQEVFTKLLEHTLPIRGEEHLKAWLIRVTINTCYDFHKKNVRLEVVSEPISKSETTHEDSVLEAVKSLQENYRNAIYLHYYEGYTAKEVGKILGAKENTVLSWLSRGREALKKIIGGFDDE
ncbi:MAG: RNA polymerase sigma factor [Clostridia bacterium]|nr:RNA polymerase sigma factor [Clostridia bacterium]